MYERTGGRPEPFCCGFSGPRGMGCLSVPLVAALEGWLLRGGQSPPATGSPAKGISAIASCEWLLFGRGGRCREARALPLRVLLLGGDGLSLRAGGCCSGAVVVEGRPEAFDGGFTGQGQTSCRSMPVVAASEGWSLSGGQSPFAVGSPARGRPVVCPCRWSLLGRGGRCGEAQALPLLFL